MKLSEQRLVLLLAYVALALGLIVILVPVYFCIWRCSKRRNKKEDDTHELRTIYDHNYH
jgi:preprotein translocase subunit YajC